MDDRIFLTFSSKLTYSSLQRFCNYTYKYPPESTERKHAKILTKGLNIILFITIRKQIVQIVISKPIVRQLNVHVQLNTYINKQQKYRNYWCAQACMCFQVPSEQSKILSMHTALLYNKQKEFCENRHQSSDEPVSTSRELAGISRLSCTLTEVEFTRP